MRLLQTVAMKCVISCLVEFMKVVTDTDTNSHLELCRTLEKLCQYLMKKLLKASIKERVIYQLCLIDTIIFQQFWSRQREGRDWRRRQSQANQ